MRPAILLCLAVAFACKANAQFTILPQIGFENTETTVTYNKGKAFSPLCENVSPQAAVRFSYDFKNAHGLFLGVATSRSILQYGFTDPEKGMNAYTTSKGPTQFRIEGGYQVSTKRIYFSDAPTEHHSLCSQYQKLAQLFSCGGTHSNNCSRNKDNTVKTNAKTKDTRVWMRIQPSIGVAYLPNTPRSDIYIKSEAGQSVYEYNAGNWSTALLTGVNFEFGKEAQSKFIISFNCVSGLCTGTKSITTGAENKSTTTTLKSYASGCNVRIGIPFSFGKKQSVSKKPASEPIYKPEHHCGQYKSYYDGQCTRKI